MRTGTTTQKFAPRVTKYRRHCKSCKQQINIGVTCLEFVCRREPITEVEEKNSEIMRMCLCEHCGELYTMLSDLSFCFKIDESMKEYAHSSWKPINHKE